MAAAKVLGLARDHFGLPHFQIVPPPVVSSETIGWRHDCREQRSWRCVWCEEMFCFECDTGTTMCIDSYPDLRLCDKHYGELPRSAAGALLTTETNYKPNTRSSLKTQFIDLRQLARRSFKAVKGAAGGGILSTKHDYDHNTMKNTGGNGSRDKQQQQLLQDDKIHCTCLWPKTLICSSCRPLANEWKMQQMGQDNVPVCAYCRFPGGCDAKPGQSCDCNGRGVDCNFIDDAAWQKMEENDILWLGRSTVDGEDSDGPYQSKKDKKDLRCVFGDNFPYRSVDHGKSADRLPRRTSRAKPSMPESPTAPRTRKYSATGSLKKKLSAGVYYLRTSRSAYSLSNAKKSLAAVPKRSLSVLSKSSSVKSSDNFNGQVETSRRSSMFLHNPQFRKPYSNFRVDRNDLSPHLPEPKKYAGGRSYLDINDVDSNYDSVSGMDMYDNCIEAPSPTQQIINPEIDFITSPPEFGSDDASSIASSPSFTFSDGYDSYEEESYHLQSALAPPPPLRPATAVGVEVATATPMNTRPLPPRLVEMRSSPNLNCSFNSYEQLVACNGNEDRGTGGNGTNDATTKIGSAGTGMLYKNMDGVVSEKEIPIRISSVAFGDNNDQTVCGTFGDSRNATKNNGNATKTGKAAKWGCSNQVSTRDFDRNAIERHAFWRCSFCDGKIKGV